MSTAPASLRPKKLGSFEILDEIGQGGMGVVYLARQPALDRLVVLKKIRRDLLTDSNMLERFQREARAAAAVHHQNVVAVYDCFEARGTHYIALELVDGEDLHAVLKRVGRMEPRIAALIGLEVLRGLAEIHARGIVHRDLKPANVMIGAGGEVKIADFGIAIEGAGRGLTRPGMLVGSLPYMSPEHLLGESVDYRSDLFLLGILLYEMVTGVPPYQESSEGDSDTLLERMQDERYDSPRKRGIKLPWYLGRLIRACLRAKPPRRWQTATDVRRVLERHLGTISPADCRQEIAEYLAKHGVMRTYDDRTALRPAAGRSPNWRWRYPRWIYPAAAAGALAIAFGAAIFGGRTLQEADGAEPVSAAGFVSKPAVEIDVDPVEPSVGDEPQAPPPPIAVEPAQVRFVVYPWAEVRVDDRPGFYTPRAEPLALEPGTHEVVFTHPSFGEAQYTVEIGAAEQRVVRHVFEEARKP